MANVNNLVNKILEDAKLKEQEILANAEVEKSKITESKVLEAEKLEKDILEKAKIEANSKQERIISNAQLQVRNKKLDAKQKVMDETFINSVEMLANLKKEDFLKYVEEKILSLDITGEENLILNSNGKAIIDKNFIEGLNIKLKNKGKKGQISISNETRNFKGGFILEKNGIEINNTFEALVNSLRDELEYEVANVLFN